MKNIKRSLKLIEMKNYLVLALLAMFVFSCSNKKQNTTVSVQPATETVNTLDGENFDLELVGQLATQSASVGEFEKVINDPETGVNNLDLDGNGEVDWITVTEAESTIPTSRLMSLAVYFSDTDVEEVATIEIDKTNPAGGEVHLVGSERLYGSGAHYHSSFSMSDAILFHYMFGPRYRPYHSPYYSYRTPAYYSHRRVVPMTAYRTQTRTVKRTTSTKSKSSFTKSTAPRKSKVSSPNKGKSSAKYTQTKDTRSKTTSQKQFNKASANQKNKLNSGNSAFKKKDTKKSTTATKSTTTKPKSTVKPKTPKKTPATYKKPAKKQPTRSTRSTRSSSSSKKRR